MRTGRDLERRLRLAEALAWDMSTQRYDKSPVSPRTVYEAQTDGCQKRFRIQAHDLIDAIDRAGLELRLAPSTKPTPKHPAARGRKP